MKNILILGLKTIDEETLISELLKEKFRIFIASKSKEITPFPFHFFQCDLYKEKINPSFMKKIDCVLSFLKDEKKIRNLVESLQKNQKVLHFSSVDAYSQSDFPLTENSLVSSTYEGQAIFKKEKLFKDLDCTIIRVPHVFGPRSKFLKRITFFTRFMCSPNIKNGNFFSWIHEKDFARAVIKLMKSSDKRSLVNLSAGQCSYLELTSELKLILNRRSLPFLSKIIKFLFFKDKIFSDHIEIQTLHKDFFDFEFLSLRECLRDCLEFKKTPTLKKEMFHYAYNSYQFIPKPIDEVFEFFKEAKNLESITPPKLNFTITNQSTPQIQEGTRFDYTLKLNKLPFHWTTIIENWLPPHQFTDYQKSGPYQVWYHTHSFFEINGGTLMQDNVKFRLPLGLLGDFFGLWYVFKNIKDIFGYRYNYIEGIYKNE